MGCHLKGRTSGSAGRSLAPLNAEFGCRREQQRGISMKKHPSTLLAAFALCLGVTGWVSSAAAADTITVGFAISQTGFMAQYDVPNANAAIMQMEEINAKGGLLGKQIKYVMRDVRSNVQELSKVGAEVAQMGVDLMIVSGDFDIGAPAAIMAQKSKIVSFSLSAADPKMGVATGPYSFSANGAAQSEGILMSEWAFNNKHYKTAYMLDDLFLEYTRSGCAGFKASWKRLSGEESFLGEDTFKNADPSIATQITRIKSLPKQPDVIFICTLPPGGPSAIRQLRAAGINTPILSVVAMGDPGWLGSMPDLSNVFVPGFAALNGDDPRPAINTFIATYKAKFGAPETTYVALGPTLIQGWAVAVDRARSTDAAKVTAELEKFKDEPLLLGATSYTKELHFQVNQPRVIFAISGGASKPLGLFRAEWVPPKELLYRLGSTPTKKA